MLDEKRIVILQYLAKIDCFTHNYIYNENHL